MKKTLSPINIKHGWFSIVILLSRSEKNIVTFVLGGFLVTTYLMPVLFFAVATRILRSFVCLINESLQNHHWWTGFGFTLPFPGKDGEISGIPTRNCLIRFLVSPN